jgi:hypothetical protein
VVFYLKMQRILWLGLILTAAACLAALAMILQDARQKLRLRRRKEHLRKWVQSETPAQARTARAS